MEQIQPEQNGGGRTETIAPFLAAAVGRGITIPEEFNGLAELLSPGGPGEIDARAEINAFQQIHIARARGIAEHYKWQVLQQFVNDLLTLSLSLNRKSRIEFAHAVRAISSGGLDESMNWVEKMRESLRN